MGDNKISGFAGERIRYLRKINNLTLENIAKLTGKSKSTISKYERGEISVDLETFYQFSEAFSVPIHHFLYQSLPISSVLPDKPDARFQANKILCIYHWDARPHRNRCLLSVVEMNTSSSQSVLYWDVADYLHYTKCNYIFYGNLLKSEPSRRFILINNVSQMDMLGINYLNPLIFHNTVICGNISSFSVGQFECYTTKCIVSEMPQNITKEFMHTLTISKSVITELRKTNVFRMNFV